MGRKALFVILIAGGLLLFGTAVLSHAEIQNANDEDWKEEFAKEIKTKDELKPERKSKVQDLKTDKSAFKAAKKELRSDRKAVSRAGSIPPGARP